MVNSLDPDQDQRSIRSDLGLNCLKRIYIGFQDGHHDGNIRYGNVTINLLFCFCLFVFVALRPMSTAMVIAGRSVHLTTLFPGQA